VGKGCMQVCITNTRTPYPVQYKANHPNCLLTVSPHRGKHLLNKFHCWTFSNKIFENVNLELPVLTDFFFSFYYYNSTVHYNSVLFFVDNKSNDQKF
jgi:hypothetical protein